MIKQKTPAFSLNELVVVVIIVAIIAAFAIPSYRKAVERNEARERDAMVQLLTDAEEIYYGDHEAYISCSGTADCNTKLDLNIPVGTWEYSVNSSGVVSVVPVSP